MIEDIQSHLEELKSKKEALKPKIAEIEENRTEELAEVNKRYDHLISDVSTEIELLEQKVRNKMIDLFISTVMDEFDAKRSVSEYVVTDDFKNSRDKLSDLKEFPKELITRLDEVIAGEPIEKIAYDIEKIENHYKI